MKFLYCLLLILILGTMSQAKQYYLRRSDAQQMLDVIRTYPELFDELFAAQETADNENFAFTFPLAVRKEHQVLITEFKKHK